MAEAGGQGVMLNEGSAPFCCYSARPPHGVLPISANFTVAVGTTIADRPPPRSVRARLRIRLSQSMSGAEACIGMGVQNAARRNPPVQDWGQTFPTHLCALSEP